MKKSFLFSLKKTPPFSGRSRQDKDGTALTGGGSHDLAGLNQACGEACRTNLQTKDFEQLFYISGIEKDAVRKSESKEGRGWKKTWGGNLRRGWSHILRK